MRYQKGSQENILVRPQEIAYFKGRDQGTVDA